MTRYFLDSGAARAVAVAIGLAVGGCSNASNDSSAPSNFGGSAGRTGSGNGSGAAGAGADTHAADAGAAVAALPPEVKVESNFESPVATGSVVWIANPASGRVAFIDAETFTVKTVQAGAGPTYLAAVPDPDKTHQPSYDMAIVIDVQSAQATLLSLPPGPDGGAPTGNPTSRLYPVTPYANAWAVSKSGRWSIAWTDTSRIANPPPLESYNRAAIIDVTNTRAPTIVGDIGFRPVQLVYSGDETQAYVVSSDGIAVIDLADGHPLRVIRSDSAANWGSSAAPDAGVLDGASDAPPDAQGPDAPSSDDAVAPGADGGDGAAPIDGDAGAMPDADAGAMPDADGGAPSDGGDANVIVTEPADSGSGAPDVSFTHDGSYALVRQDGVASIIVVALATGQSTRVSLPDVPTDLALSPDGTFAVAVLRATSTVVTMPIPGIVTAPRSFSTITVPGETIGRAVVAGDNRSVLLFTTVANIDRIAVLTLGAAPAVRAVALHAPVLGVFPTADGKNAIILHNVSSIPSTPGAFSVLPIATQLPASIQPLVAPAVAVALTDDRALVTVNGGPSGPYAVYRVDLGTLVPVEIPLASPPLAVGVVSAAAEGYVAQDYSEGRITFIGLGGTDAGTRTITGFELSAGIVQGSEQ